jgi:prolyl 4-hydroxylase
MQQSVQPGASMASIETLIRAGRRDDAAAMMETLAGAGNADALFALGLWRLGGHIVTLDVQQARDLFLRAGEAGRLDGARTYVNLLAAGVGGPADWPDALARLRGMADGGDARSRAALALLDAMALAEDGGPVSVPQGEPICESPRALRFDDIFTPAECAYLIEAATPLMSPSVVVDERSGRLVPHPIRTSDTALFPWLLADPAITALNRRLAVASGTALDQGEPLQVLRYTPGQQYRDHLDAIAGASNQRIMTMIVYLTDDYDGGETRFVQAGIDHRGRRGDALLFHNALADGRADPRSEHAGLPVTRGAKLIASRWIRAKPFAADA